MRGLLTERIAGCGEPRLPRALSEIIGNLAAAVGVVRLNILRLKEKPPSRKARGFLDKALAVTYFRMGRPHTIIGDTPFHF